MLHRKTIALGSALAAVLTLVGTLGVAAVLDFPTLGIDDANITMVYGRNLAEGHGFVFTPGWERVEGFTSMAWTLVVGASYLLTESPEKLLLVVSVLLCAVTVAAVLGLAWRLAREAFESRLGVVVSAAAALVWLAGLPEFFAWNTVTLMDLVLWTALLNATTLVLVWDATAGGADPRTPWVVGALAGLLVLCRPEAMAVAPGLVGLGVITAVTPDRGWAAALRRFAPSFALVAVAIVGLTTFRLFYFGYPLPNTYYAKVSPDRLYNVMEGMRYVGSFLWDAPIRIACILASVGLAGWGVTNPARRTRSERAGLIVSAVCLGGIALPLVGGGDHFDAHRFLQPFSPLLVLPLLAGAAVVGRRLRSEALPARAGWAALAVASLAGISWIYSGWWDFAVDRPLKGEFTITARGRTLGETLNEAFPTDPLPRVGGLVAGGLGLTYRGRMDDLLGLNWTAMGHSAGDRKGEKNHSAFNADVFWSDPPDLVTPLRTINPPEQSDGLAIDLYREVLDDLYTTPRFRAAYEPGYVRTDSAVLSGFFSRTWLEHHGPEGFVPLGW